MTTTTHTDSRLTADDWQRIERRMSGAIAGWIHSTTNRVYTVRAVDAPTLDRLAHAAIGCTADDLRDSELDAIAAHVATYIGHTYRPTAARWDKITRVSTNQHGQPS